MTTQQTQTLTGALALVAATREGVRRSKAGSALGLAHAHVVDACAEALIEQGVTVEPAEQVTQIDGDRILVCVTWRVCHAASGETRTMATSGLATIRERGATPDQLLGSAWTYAHKNLLRLLLLIGDEHDGVASTAISRGPSTPETAQPAQSSEASRETVGQLLERGELARVHAFWAGLSEERRAQAKQNTQWPELPKALARHMLSRGEPVDQRMLDGIIAALGGDEALTRVCRDAYVIAREEA